MSVHNLAIVFAPTLLRGESSRLNELGDGREVVESLIAIPWIFQNSEQQDVELVTITGSASVVTEQCNDKKLVIGSRPNPFLK